MTFTPQQVLYRLSTNYVIYFESLIHHELDFCVSGPFRTQNAYLNYQSGTKFEYNLQKA